MLVAGDDLFRAWRRAADVAELLADGVADVNATKRRCTSPARMATLRSSRGCSLRADVEKADNDDCTPLWIACCQGHTEVVTTLIAANADVNNADNSGVTPLIIACGLGRAEIVAKLLGADANVNQADNSGVRPLIVACFKGHLGIVQSTAPTAPSPSPRRRHENTSPPTAATHVAAWLVRSRLWLALLRAGADIHAAAEPGGPASRSRRPSRRRAARRRAPRRSSSSRRQSRGAKTISTSSRRARAPSSYCASASGSRLPNDPIPFEVFEVFVMPHEVTRDYQPRPPAAHWVGAIDVARGFSRDICTPHAQTTHTIVAHRVDIPTQSEIPTHWKHALCENYITTQHAGVRARKS